MDENILNDLFRDLLENKMTAAPPSSYSPSEISTLNSSLAVKTYLSYEDIIVKFQSVLSNIIEMNNDIENLKIINISG